MKRLIFILLLFISAFAFGQGVPLNPIPLTQNSMFLEPSTGLRWGNNGAVHGWYRIDTINNIYISNQFKYTGTIPSQPLNLMLDTVWNGSSAVMVMMFDSVTHSLRYYPKRLFGATYTANNGLLDTVISGTHYFQLGGLLTKNTNINLNGNPFTINYGTGSMSNTGTGFQYVNSHGVNMTIGGTSDNGAIIITSGTFTTNDVAIFNKGVQINNTSGLGSTLFWTDDNIHTTARWSASLVSPGSLQFQSAGFTNNGIITLLGTNAGEIADQNGIKFIKGTGTNLQYFKGDGTLGTYSAGSGTVMTISGVAANGFTWSIANATTTPAITLTLQNATTTQAGQLTSTDWNTFNGKLSANQTITFTPTGDVTGSTTGTTSLTPVLAIGSGKVTNTMLLGSIAFSKLIGTDITTVGTLAAGSIPYSLLTGTPSALPPGGTAGGELAGTYPNPTLLNSAVIGKVLTGYTSGAGNVASTDNILQAIQKLNGNIVAIGTPVTAVTGTTNRITSSGGTTPAIDISSTFEALLGKVANPLSQFASTTSAQLAGVLSDETGTGVAVFSASPTFTGTPAAPTATVGTNTTQIATTAFVLANAGGLASTNFVTDESLTISSGSGTLANTPVTGKISITQNGINLQPGVDFSASGSTITIISTVFSNDVFLATYIK